MTTPHLFYYTFFPSRSDDDRSRAASTRATSHMRIGLLLAESGTLVDRKTDITYVYPSFVVGQSDDPY
jgi:hypothetical protein